MYWGSWLRSELQTWLSQQHNEGFAGRREPDSILNARAVHGGGDRGSVCSSDLANTCSPCHVFSQSPSQGQHHIHGNQGFPTCGFHGQRGPSEDAEFQGKPGFSCLESHKSYYRNAGEIRNAALSPFLIVPGRASASELHIKPLQAHKGLKDCPAHTEENIVTPKIRAGRCKNGSSDFLQQTVMQPLISRLNLSPKEATTCIFWST